MYSVVKKPFDNILRSLGLSLIRNNSNPESTLLGLRNLPVFTILDIGANTGQSARHFRHLFPEAVIYSFEPLPDVYHQLEVWARTQGGKVRTMNVGLGDDSGEATMNRHLDHSASSSLLPVTANTIQLYPQTQRQATINVQVHRLDDLERNLDLRKEMLIKMDVQGFEARVIQGGRNVIRQAIGCILEVSLHQLYEGQPDFEDLSLALSSLGFKYAGNINQTYDMNGSVVFLDTLFVNQKLLEQYPKYNGLISITNQEITA